MGKGDLFEARLRTADLKRCEVEIMGKTKRHQKRYALHMAVAPTKNNDRFEWFLEKATEIGVSEITPILCARSERKIIKLERIQKVVQAAMKQSLQLYLPKVNDAISFTDFMNLEKKGFLFIAHCEESEKMDLMRRVLPDRDITILIGPEGDFTHEEINLARENGFLPISLGENRLRTETAALVACTIVAVVNNE